MTLGVPAFALWRGPSFILEAVNEEFAVRSRVRWRLGVPLVEGEYLDGPLFVAMRVAYASHVRQVVETRGGRFMAVPFRSDPGTWYVVSRWETADAAPSDPTPLPPRLRHPLTAA